MADIVWLIQRLKAMNIFEVIWRISQKNIQKKEGLIFRTTQIPITCVPLPSDLAELKLLGTKLNLNTRNLKYSLNTSIPLLGNYDYKIYKKLWNAGFQTNATWPLKYSYTLEYRQRDDIGDARTNWELNRHFQFVLLAKTFAITKNKKYLTELQELFDDWNCKNPFLWGISWTSVMEIAIRTSNWCYTYCFLQNTPEVPAVLLEQLQIGILNMTSYIAKHHSRYSSANNHLIVEAYAIGQSGILFEYSPWINLAIKILTQELPLQNYCDGINKELSLHYQVFYMEAMGLMIRLLVKNQISVPESWKLMLCKMCEYVADCMGNYGEVIAFGDDDEGKILDLHGGLNYYQYVLGLLSYLLHKQYVDLANIECENLNWLFTEEEKKKAVGTPHYQTPQTVCFKEGGNSIFRSNDRKILIGVDHAALGFGRIAAHGHADALSFQMYVDGIPIFVDPGTYIYHCDIKSRNAYRRTENHNTVCMDDKDQSKMLGAFLWGHKAECSLLEFKENANVVVLKAMHNGYHPEIHTREFIFDKKEKFEIIDMFSSKNEKTINFLFSPLVNISVNGNNISFKTKLNSGTMTFECAGDFFVKEQIKSYSDRYATQTTVSAICVRTCELCVKTIIKITHMEDTKSGNSHAEKIKY